jgi:hypothetical protein
LVIIKRQKIQIIAYLYRYGDEKMASVRVRGVGAKIDDKKILQKAKQIRDTFGSDFKIIIEKNHITVEGKMTHEERKKIDQILAS